MNRSDGLPTPYARAREQRRGAQAWTLSGFVVMLDSAMALKVGAAMLLVLPAAATAFLAIAAMSRSLPTDRPTRSWPAQIPVSLVRSQGVALRGRLRDTAELTGRLQLVGDHLEWQPSVGSVRLGAISLTWPLTALADASITPLWGIVPMSLVHINDESGEGADVWVRSSASRITSAFRLANVAHA